MSLHLSIVSKTLEAVYEKSFASNLTVHEFKKRLELITGIPNDHIQLEQRDKDNKITRKLTIDDENKTLDAIALKSGDIISVESNNIDEVNLSHDLGAAHYVIDNQKYEQRPAFKKKMMEEATVDTSYLKVGQKVLVRLGGQEEKVGRIGYVGPTHFKEGIWLGIVYEQSLGKNDGSIDGKRYFTCPPNHGSFVKPSNVVVVDEPIQDEPIEEL